MKINMLAYQFGARNKRLKRRGISYDEYLLSPRWKSIKEYLSNFSEYQSCQCCKSTDNLNYHHQSYRSLFKPLRKQKGAIVRLCKSCHYRVHKLQKEKNFGLGQALRFMKKELPT